MEKRANCRLQNDEGITRKYKKQIFNPKLGKSFPSKMQTWNVKEKQRILFNYIKSKAFM